MCNKKLLIWGIGKRCSKVFNNKKYFDFLFQYNIVGFIDSYSTDKYYMDKNVYRPCDLENVEFDKIILSVSGNIRKEIEKETKTLYPNIYSKFDSFLTDKLEYNFTRMIMYQEHTSKYKKSYIEVGDFTYGIPEIIKFNNENSDLVIGKYCSLASGIKILLGGEHETKFISTYPFSLWMDRDIIDHHTKGNVRIGNDVWIGSDVKILSGVTIGNGAVIAANSVVVGKVEPYSIYGGNPAKLIKYRFDKNTITMLEKIQWWNWSDDLIIEAVPILQSNDIKMLKEFYEKRVCS